MRKLLWLLPILLFLSARPASAQLANAQGWCEAGAQNVITSGLVSTTQVQESVPFCTVSVSIHGGGTATIFSTGSSTPLSNPFQATSGGRWIFYAANGEYDITLTCTNTCVPPTPNPFPVTYSDVFITNVISGGGGGGTPCVTVVNSIQYNNSGVFGCAQGINTPDGNSLVVKGPNPSANLAAFTRTVGFNGCSTTATINIGTPTTATLASGACFQTNNGLFNDGITIYNAGPAVTISSPSAPTVTPNTISSGGVNLGGGNYTPNTVVNGATGASTYSYILVAFDQFGGFAAPSVATTIANGPATLGAFSCAISTETRSGTDVTKNYSSACAGSVAGAMSLDTGTQPNPMGVFGGFYNARTVNSSTQVVYAGPYNSASFGWNSTDNGNSGTNSSTGGTSYFFNSNHLRWTYGAGVWRYGICAERPGDVTYHAIGMTRPSTSVAKDIQFDDYGATMMASFKLPPYFTDAVCNGAAGQNDPLTTPITAGAGTTTVTLANAASNGVTGATALFDNGPGLIAAANSVAFVSSSSNGELLIPPPQTNVSNNYYVINSYTALTGRVKIKQAGNLVLNETLSLPSGAVWTGEGSSQCTPTAFQYFTSNTACVYMNNANPAVYIASGMTWLQNLNFLTNASANWGTMIVDDSPHGRFSNIGLSPDGATDSDFLSIPLVLRGGNGSADCQYDLDHIGFGMAGFSTTPGSWNPGIFIPSAQDGTGALAQGGCIVNLSKIAIGLHGMIQEGGGVDWNIDNPDRQGGIMPFLWHLNGGATNPENLSFNTVSLDTDGGSLLSIGNNTGVRVTDNVKAYNVKAIAGTTFGGFGPSSLDMSYSNTTTTPNANGGFVRQCATTNFSLTSLNCNFDYNAYIGPNAKIYAPLAAPTGLSNSAVSGGTNTANIAVQFELVAYDPAGNYTIASAASSSATTSGTCPGSGNCQFQLGYTPVTGAVNYTVIGCQVSGTPLVLFSCPTYTNIPSATNITTNPVTMNTLGGGSGLANISVTLAGSSGWTAGDLWGPLFAASEGTAPTCSTNYDVLFGIASGHRLSFCNNGGSVDQVVGAATTDTLTKKTFGDGVTATEIPSMTGVGGTDQFWPNSVAHRWEMINNNGTPDVVVGANTTDILANKTINGAIFTGAGSGSGAILLTGQRDGLVPVNATTTTPCTFGTSGAGCFDKAYVTGYAFNQHATAGQAITYNLPTAAAGKQFCAANSNNGSAANTGIITVATSASGQFIIFTDGTLSASGGNVTSGGAAADAACFVGIDSTHWQQFTQSGTWTKH